LKFIKHILPLGTLLFLVAVPFRAEAHKLRVSDPALARTLLAGGGTLIADYGSFQYIESDSPTAAWLGAPAARLADDEDVIQLNARRLDTRRADVRAMRKPVGAFSGKRLHLVQFAGPIKPDWLKALEQSGAQIVSYVPHNAYLVYGSAGELARLQAQARSNPHIQWDGDYADDFKIHPLARLTDGKGRPRQPATDLFAVQLLADTNSNPATLALLDQLKLGPVRSRFRSRQYLNVIVPLPADQLTRVAARPEVVSIQPWIEPRKLDERQDQILAGNVTTNGPSGPGYLAWLAARGFTQAQFDASGFVVDISDSGIDNGTNTPGHFGLYTLGDPLQASRVVYNRLEGIPNSGSTVEGCDGHGTLNAHIVAGFCDLSGFPFTDSAGYAYGLGVCPFVKLGSSVVFDPYYFTGPSYADLQSLAYQSEARVSANSWGAEVSGVYDVDSQAYDALVRDAQPSGSAAEAPGNQEMVIVFAAGNAGPYSSSIDSPGTAKNVITVGASENERSLAPAEGGVDGSGADGCAVADSGADNFNDIAAFSSRGPCVDGRMKPDLVAPGTHVTGGAPQTGPPGTNDTGSALACFDGTGVCGLPGGGTAGSPDNFFPLAQQYYTVSSGTSHSTPAVAGACALLRQYFINQSLSAPSPAMTKAWLINSARYLTGVDANDNLWSPNQGMGGLDLGMAFDGVPRLIHDQEAIDTFTNTGETRTFTGTIADPSRPFRVTLAWTDAPGNTFGNAINNDLDLTVSVGGLTYKGNVFAGALSTTNGTYDRLDNVECVFLPAGLSGSFIITVTAANINSDGVPNEAPDTDQDFALVAYNAHEAMAPVLVVDSVAVTGENCGVTNHAIDPNETVTLAVALRNMGNGNTTNLTVTLLQTNGVVLPSAPQTYGVVAAGGAAVTQAFSFLAVGTCGATIHARLQMQDGAAALGTLDLPLGLGVDADISRWTTNSATIIVPASDTLGPASPYPSDILVSGVTSAVSKVTVTLVGFTHTYPADVDVLLTGPNGTNVLLMSFCGDSESVTNLTLTFDDNAESPVPSAALTSGVFQPTAYQPGTVEFPAPAPPLPYGGTLSVFNASDPNGTWSLYAQDHAYLDVGTISQGWRISITSSNRICCYGSILPAPVLENVSLSNNVAMATWTSIPGLTYRLQYRTDLNGTNWTSLPDVIAVDTTTCQTDTVNSAAQRFYRVLLIP
jgi:subtilisin-like proprotein convertase family protein